MLIGVEAIIKLKVEKLKKARDAVQMASAKFAKLSGQELGTVTANMEAGFKSFVQTNKVGLNIKDVMNDVGSASKATGNFKAKKNPIIATDPMVARFQKLAGLK